MILVGLLGLFFTGVTAQTADNRKAVRKAERAQRTASDITMRTDKKGYVFFDMNVVGIGISASVEITLFPGNNSASVTVLPNFNMNRVTLEGKLIPYDGSAVIEGAPY